MPRLGLSALALRRTGPAEPGLLRMAATAYRHAPTYETALALALITGVATAAATSLGHSPLRAALVSGAVVLLLHVAIRRPAMVATGLILAGYALCIPVIAQLFLVASGSADYPLAVTALWCGALLSALVAHRRSVGRAPVTVILALGAMSVAGPLLAFVAPAAGFLGGFAAAAAVLAWRARHAGLPVRRRTTQTAAVSDPATAHTATLLADLPPEYTVLTGVHPPRAPHPAQHVVIGPSGLTVVASHARTGVVREHPTRGLELDGQALTSLLAEVSRTAHRLADALAVNADAVAAVVVLQGAHLPSPRTVVALVDATGRPDGHVVVVAPAALVDEVTAVPDATDPKVVATLVKRAKRLRGSKAVSPEPTGSHTATVIDGNGLPKQFAEPDAPQPLFRSTSVDSVVLVGQAVALLTDQGTFSGVRVCSAPAAEVDGTIAVQVCLEGEWQQARAEQRDPDTFPYPLASVSAG